MAQSDGAVCVKKKQHKMSVIILLESLAMPMFSTIDMALKHEKAEKWLSSVYPLHAKDIEDLY